MIARLEIALRALAWEMDLSREAQKRADEVIELLIELLKSLKEASDV